MNPLAAGSASGVLASGVLRWTAGPLSFELASPHPEILERGRVVFRPWMNGDAGRRVSRIRFRIEADGESSGWRVSQSGEVETTPAGSIDGALSVVEYAATAAMVAPESGLASVHAALVSRGSRGVLLVGRKESGKSTLACALLAAGWLVHSDDTVLIENGPRVRGVPRRVSLRGASRELLGSRMWERILALPGTARGPAGVLFQPGELLACETPASVEPAAAVFLGRWGATAPPARLQRIDPARALLALALHCNSRNLGIGPALAAVQPLADRVQSYDLGRGALDGMVARVEEAAG